MTDARNGLLTQGIEFAPFSAEQFTTFAHAKIVKWSEVVKGAGIKPE